MTVYELNLDGLVGPTHHYAGLGQGNIASICNAHTVSNPQAAALQGLKKMRLLYNMGLKQGILPPHQRPNLKLLHQLGFGGSTQQQIKKAYENAPELLRVCFSASSMWSANAATVSASSDTLDKKLHFTAANLVSNLHRHQEANFSKHLLRSIFSNPEYFIHHPISPSSSVTMDEGAANHNRLCQNHQSSGVNIFVYGRKTMGINKQPIPICYPARQTKEASEIIVRSHLLNQERVIFAQQNPNSIDQGVFHNDVIAVANESVFLIHEEALHNQSFILNELKQKALFPLTIVEVSSSQISIKEAVDTYLFNSQLMTLPNGKGMILISPVECSTHDGIKTFINNLINDTSNPINFVEYIDLRQSMKNGGGPACLRLRVPISTMELAAMHQGVLVDNSLLNSLEAWVLKHYRTELQLPDFLDPQLIDENFRALDQLTQILKLGSIYPFQIE
ncbi:MAG: N-succinylarginine dihydrolase [bacterium]|nr:N-succinylarginine dihydrolase [bacterium]